MIDVVLPTEPPDSMVREAKYNPLPLSEEMILGFISNGKPSAWALLDAIGRGLENRKKISEFFIWQKPSSAKVVTEEERSEMLARAHIVISGLGD